MKTCLRCGLAGSQYTHLRSTRRWRCSIIQVRESPVVGNKQILTGHPYLVLSPNRVNERLGCCHHQSATVHSVFRDSKQGSLVHSGCSKEKSQLTLTFQNGLIMSMLYFNITMIIIDDGFSRYPWLLPAPCCNLSTPVSNTNQASTPPSQCPSQSPGVSREYSSRPDSRLHPTS